MRYVLKYTKHRLFGPLAQPFWTILISQPEWATILPQAIAATTAAERHGLLENVLSAATAPALDQISEIRALANVLWDMITDQALGNYTAFCGTCLLPVPAQILTIADPAEAAKCPSCRDLECEIRMIDIGLLRLTARAFEMSHTSGSFGLPITDHSSLAVMLIFWLARTMR